MGPATPSSGAWFGNASDCRSKVNAGCRRPISVGRLFAKFRSPHGPRRTFLNARSVYCDVCSKGQSEPDNSMIARFIVKVMSGATIAMEESHRQHEEEQDRFHRSKSRSLSL